MLQRVFWEDSGVLTTIVVSVSVLAALMVACFAAYKINFKSFKLDVTVFKVLTVTFEVESPSEEPARRTPAKSKVGRLR